MSSGDQVRPIIAFLWHPKAFLPEVVNMARQTGTTAILDCTGMSIRDIKSALGTARGVDLKISVEVFMEEVRALIVQEPINRIWVDFHPLTTSYSTREFIQHTAMISKECPCIPVVSDWNTIRAILAGEHEIDSFALKGCEAAGFGSGDSLMNLYSTVREEIRPRLKKPDIIPWGGIAVPEAAAAFLTTGAKGIVFESLHWLTDLANMPAEQKQHVKRLKVDHTGLACFSSGLSCRLFNRGNSQAFTRVQRLACAEDSKNGRDAFIKFIQKNSLHPYESSFERNEIIPLGVEACYANSFHERYGSITEDAVNSFLLDIIESCVSAHKKSNALSSSMTAADMGTRFPIVQGAMSWITDNPEFAKAVADGGALPTVALGTLPGSDLDPMCSRLIEIMNGHPFALNLVALQENPFREEHFKLIRRMKPKFAVIGAGSPSMADVFADDGIETIYVAPNTDMFKLACDSGIRWVICEGNEAGGHVGPLTTLTFAQSILDLKRRNPGIYENIRVILAGGIHNRLTACMAMMMGADAIQMGTSYLATREIVETGALSEVYQQMILDSLPGETVLTGQTVGLSVRSLNTPRIQALRFLEHQYVIGRIDESTYRSKVEVLAAGSLSKAAKCKDETGGTFIDASVCREQGQFMAGSSSGALKRLCTVKELHHEVADAPIEISHIALRQNRENEPVRGPLYERHTVKMKDEPNNERIAVTGIAIMNSLGRTPEEIWSASMRLKSGIIDVPESRWNMKEYFSSDLGVPEKSYCTVAAFHDFNFSRKELGVSPHDFKTMAQSTKQTLWLAGQCIHDSGILESSIPPEKIGVLVSQNSAEAAGTLADIIIRNSADELLNAMKGDKNIPSEVMEIIGQKLKKGRTAIDDTTLLGRLNCGAGGFISNLYGFRGPSYSVSAACATSLVALYNAVTLIRAGVIDAAVVGGGEEPLTPLHFLEFSALRALAGVSGKDRRPEQMCRPFDRGRDGMVLGEGGGMLVVERESLAYKRGTKVHAYITGIGASNNNTSLIESSHETQQIAIKSSFKGAGYGPDQVELIECHATGTITGDMEEVKALQFFYNSGRRTILTSFKSQIGHTLGASGISSLIRGIMSINAGIFPPSINCDHPDTKLELGKTGFAVLPEPDDWVRDSNHSRKMEVNAFGFGGANYVVQIEENRGSADTVFVQPKVVDSGKFSEDGISETSQTIKGISFYTNKINSESYRIAIIAHTPEHAEKKLREIAVSSNEKMIAAPFKRKLEVEGIYFERDESPPPSAFVFPGQGSYYVNMGRELFTNLPLVRHWMEKANSLLEFDVLEIMFNGNDEDLQNTRRQQPALFTLEYALARFLLSLGVKPSAMAGHSLGEITALCIAGVYSFEDALAIVEKRAQCMAQAFRREEDPGTMAATDAPVETVEEMVRQSDDLFITNYNSPRQTVIGGNRQAVEKLDSDLKRMGFSATQLRVSMAFHSPIMKNIRNEFGDFLSRISFRAPSIPVMSNATRQPYSSVAEEIREALILQLESPVYWIHNVKSLRENYDISCFLEVGPRNTLSDLISDTLTDVRSIPMCMPGREYTSFLHAVAQLFTNGNLINIKHAMSPSMQRPESKNQLERVLPTAPVCREHFSSSTGNSVGDIIQSQINSFILESFGTYLKPKIIAQIREKLDAAFTEQDLNSILDAKESVSENREKHIDESKAPSRMEMSAPDANVRDDDASDLVPSFEEGDVLEQVIRLIMDATGYERAEIEPDMDLRQDLAIRSSRLPVIIDAAEKCFKITINFEDFLEVRTVRDVATRVDALTAKRSTGGFPHNGGESAYDQTGKQHDRPAVTPDPIRRYAFRRVPIEMNSSKPLEFSKDDTVIILSAAGKSPIALELKKLLEHRRGVSCRIVSFLQSGKFWSRRPLDIRDETSVAQFAEKFFNTGNLAGIVLLFDEFFDSLFREEEDLPRFLTGFFSCFKAFLHSPDKKFFLLMQNGNNPGGLGRVASEGITGILLSAIKEHPTVRFKSLRIDASTPLESVVNDAIDKNSPIVEYSYREGKTSTLGTIVQPVRISNKPLLSLGPEDIIVVSGGSTGVTWRFLKTLIPFGPRIILMGRSSLDPDICWSELRSALSESGNSFVKGIRRMHPDLPLDELERRSLKYSRAIEIQDTIKTLQTAGIKVSYVTCDVSDGNGVRAVIGDLVGRYGKIDGIIHGAGILHDQVIDQMTSREFASVTRVKLQGAMNLFKAAEKNGLRFFVGLSSIVSVLGNPGQANYCAANRAMSAYMRMMRARNHSIVFKAMVLPPVKDTGMANTEEIRLSLKRKGLESAYVHADEISQVLVRELFLAPSQDVWVMFGRSLPMITSEETGFSRRYEKHKSTNDTNSIFVTPKLPMIDSITNMDLALQKLEAQRIFSVQKDLWIGDHRPFKKLKNPFVSAVMAVEACIESAYALAPHLKAKGVRNFSCLKFIECPPDAPRKASISCRKAHEDGRDIYYEVLMNTQEMNSFREEGRLFTNYSGEAIVSGCAGGNVDLPEDFPRDKRVVPGTGRENAEIVGLYQKHSGLTGRYRVLREIEGINDDFIRARMQYGDEKDFSDNTASRYLYPVYVLESLIQMTFFYAVIRDKEEKRSLVPVSFNDMQFSRLCRTGEMVRLHGLIQSEDEFGFLWKLTALDQEGKAVMIVSDLRIKWFDA